MAAADSYQRGTIVLTRRQTARLVREEQRIMARGVGPGAQAILSIAGVPLTIQDEKQHCKFIGITGSGKTTAISHLIGAAISRGDRAIIADPDGIYSARFHDATRGDIIFNPFNDKSPQWDIFREINNGYDIEDLARCLIPDSPDSHDNEWREYARTFLTDVTERLWEGGQAGPERPTMQDLHHLLTRASVKEMRKLLANTPSAAFLDEHAEKMFASIRAVTSSAVRAFRYIAQQDTPPLSIREWIKRDDRKGGVLFLPYHAGEIEALRSTISAWMRLGIFEAMNRPEGDQRLWFVIDELSALGRIGGLTDGLTRLRKFGGRVVLGFQSIDQVEALYGKNDANAIVENCGNTLLLRCGTSDEGGTCAFASKLIGEREMLRKTRSVSQRGLTDFIGSRTQSEQYHTEHAVMAAEIEQLPNHAGFLRVSSRPEWMQVSVPPLAQPRTRSGAGSMNAFFRRMISPLLGHALTPGNLNAASAASRTESQPSTPNPAPAEPPMTPPAAPREGHPPDMDSTTIPAHALSGFFRETARGVYVHVQTNAEAFRDEGLRLTTRGEDQRVIESLVAFAEARNWEAVTVKGTQEFRKAAWLNATLAGIEVHGYDPSRDDRRLLEMRKEHRNEMIGAEKAPPARNAGSSDTTMQRGARRFSIQEKKQLLQEAAGLQNDEAAYGKLLARWSLTPAHLRRWQTALTSSASLDEQTVRALARSNYRAARDAGKSGAATTQTAHVDYGTAAA